MNTHPSLQVQPDQPRQGARRPRRRKLRHVALAAAVLAGSGGLMLVASGIASASVDQTSSQYAEIGPYGYTGDQSSQVTAVYTIKNVAEPGTEMLEDNGNNMNNGGVVDVWTQAHQGTYQDPMSTGPYGPITQANYLWEFVPADPSDGGSIAQNWGELINRQSGLCLDIANNNTSDGAAMDQWTCNGGANQQWAAEPVNGNYYLIPLLDMSTPNAMLGVGNGSSCTTNGDGDSVYARTTGTIGNPCDEWDIQQASYDFATHPIGVPDNFLLGSDGDNEADGRGYECVNGDNLRLNSQWNTFKGDFSNDPWDYDNLSASGVTVTFTGSQANSVTGGDIQYSQITDATGDLTGQIMLYCDPPTTTP
jgi:hypothetical protein